MFLKLVKRLSASNSPLLFAKLQVLILTPDLLNQDLQREVPCASILSLGNKLPQLSGLKQNILLTSYHLIVSEYQKWRHSLAESSVQGLTG